jgi:pimeloyl-ACP methyl ester carboxylesterase
VRRPHSRIRRAQPPLTRTSTFTDDDLTLVVKESVERPGRPFVLVHGIGVASRYFGPLASALMTVGPVYVVELPGMGQTPEPREATPIERYGGLLGRWMQSAGLADAILVGHSMGSQVVTETALQSPQLVGHVVMIGSVTNDTEKTVLHQAMRLAQDSLLERPDVNWIVLSDYVRCGPRWMLKLAPLMVAYPLLDRAAGLSRPVLVMRGTRDPISPYDWNRRLVDAIPDARLQELEGRAHVGMYVDAADAAGEIVRFAAIADRVAPTREAGVEAGRE